MLLARKLGLQTTYHRALTVELFILIFEHILIGSKIYIIKIERLIIVINLINFFFEECLLFLSMLRVTFNSMLVRNLLSVVKS